MGTRESPRGTSTTTRGEASLAFGQNDSAGRARAPLTETLPAALSAADVQRIEQALADSRAPATRAQYLSAWRAWAEWAGLTGNVALPADPAAVAAYLTQRTEQGASTTETMLAGGWKTARMVAHYAAGVVAEQGAVAKYL